MKSIVADDGMLSTLGQAKELTEIRDGNGRLLGFFAPASLKNAQHYATGATQFDPLEIERRRQEQLPGRTTQEVLGRLQ
jgi:hypothetical protein